MRVVMILFAALAAFAQKQLPHAFKGGYELPNGWRITPVGKAIPTEDLLLRLRQAPDGAAVVAVHAGFNPHGLVVIDARTGEAAQHIALKSAWLGLAWHPDGKRLYVSGGNANGRKSTMAPIYVFSYAAGRLSKEPVARLEESIPKESVFWSGVAHHPKKNLLFAANRGTTQAGLGSVVVFDTATNRLLKRIPVDVNPYDVVLSPGGERLYVSNWASASVSVIDTAAMKVIGVIPVEENPNDMVLGSDGRLYVACSQRNGVLVIDTSTRQVVERIHVALFPRAPEGSTPNALALDDAGKLLFVANADNNCVAVVQVARKGESEVLGFIPAGWYPSALAIDARARKLYVGNGKGLGSYAALRGPHSPIPGDEGRGTVKSLQKGSVNIVNVANLVKELKGYTKRVYENTPYHDRLLAEAKPAPVESVVPSAVGAGSPIEHVIYIIKENRTYDQVFGDLPQGNGDPRLTLFGRQVTPNQHALAEQFVLFDNLYCDGEVSVDGHSWSNSAWATDFNEKLWPVTYGGHGKAAYTQATVPVGGHLWDLAKRKGLTYRSYGEHAGRASDGTTMQAAPGSVGLVGHVAPKFKLPGMRDTDNVAEFIREFDEYEKNFASTDPARRLPNYIVMSLPENHTRGTSPGAYTPTAMVANNDYAVGLLVDRVTHSKYWPKTAIFIIEDDAQDGADHVDARRTVGLAISPYIRRRTVDSTLYTTSSMLRTIELLLGLPPMSQYDAAANPMYKAFGVTADLTPFKHLKPQVDVNARNTARAWGAKKSLAMDFSDVDRTDMHELNEVIWKSVKGADSVMPPSVHSFRFTGR